jgi:23S rRNA pseudouridine2605 synthase
VAVERLQRALARAGFGSRRACEELIASGRVTVNGTVATLGDRIDPAVDEVRVKGDRIVVDPEMRYLAFHKPKARTSPRVRASSPSGGSTVTPRAYCS